MPRRRGGRSRASEALLRSDSADKNVRPSSEEASEPASEAGAGGGSCLFDAVTDGVTDGGLYDVLAESVGLPSRCCEGTRAGAKARLLKERATALRGGGGRCVLMS